MSGTGCGCCACLAGAGERRPIFNRPGLGAIRYRIGTHATFLDAMLRRLTVSIDGKTPYSLHELTTRESDDPAIALLDAWAVVGDVLTFYQERIANEAFLATATERRSILELGRLAGYTLEPGVSASAYLAYTLEDGAKTVIPAGSKAQSVPGAGEQPQMFETSADTEARASWNALLPRMRKPQDITLENVLTVESVWIDGTTTRIEKREPVFFVFETPMKRILGDNIKTIRTIVTEVHAIHRVREVIVDDVHKRTRLLLETVRPYYTNLYDAVLEAWRTTVHSFPAVDPCALPRDDEPAPPIEPAEKRVGASRKTSGKKRASRMNAAAHEPFDLDRLFRDILLGVPRRVLYARHRTSSDFRPLLEAEDDDPVVVLSHGRPENLEELLSPLIRARGVAPASQWQLGRSLAATVNAASDLIPRVLSELYPRAGATIYTAYSNVASGDRPYSELRSVHILRRQTRVFGFNAPPALFEDRPNQPPAGYPTPLDPGELPCVIHLASPEEAAAPGTYVVTINREGARARKVLEAQTKPRAAYAVSGDSTRLALSGDWWSPGTVESNVALIRDTTVFVANEPVVLAQQILTRPIGKPVEEEEITSESPMRIELDAVVEGLTPGRHVIVTGVRADTSGTSGIVSAELMMVANVELNLDSGAGGTAYSILELAPDGLAYQYDRATVKILGNVVHATNGDTHHQILGGGDASQALQTFTLNQSPLTFVSAPTIDGVVSTLVVRVNDVRWHETETLAGAGPIDRLFTTKVSDEGKVSITFGTGREGMRLPTGTDNVRATYRAGIGRAGNVRAGQISNAVSRPLGVRDVINPTDAAGGADPQSRDDARRTIPVSLQSLGRIVSVRD